MRKFTITLSVLILACAFIIAMLEYRYKNYITSYDYVFSYFYQKKDSVKTVYIGNSHTGALGTVSTIKNNNVVNLSSQGLDLFKIYCTLKKIIPQASKLNKVYLGLDYEMIGQNQTVSGEEYIERQYYKYIDTLYHYDFANRLMSNSHFFRSNRDLKFFFKKDNGADAIERANAFIPTSSKNKNLNDVDCKKRSREHSVYKFRINLIDENINYLLAIMHLCKENNVRLYLFNAPKSNCYCQHVNIENINYAKHKIDSIALFHNQIYYDYYNSTMFYESDFADYDHLNFNGATKLVYHIDSTIEYNKSNIK